MAHCLRERFHQLEDSETDTILWNEYELNNVSPASVGNRKSSIHCSDTAPLYQMAEYEAIDVAYYFYYFDADALAQCWSLTNEFGNVMRAGYHYGYDSNEMVIC